MLNIRIKSWKWAGVSLLFISVFIGLGCWQLSRAHQKKILLDAFLKRTKQIPLNINTLHSSDDLRFYRAHLQGYFDNQHTFLLDNKIAQGKIGYEVYTPFKPDHLAITLLIDRGFVPMGQSRRILPLIPSIVGHVDITGMLNIPPRYFAWGEMKESTQITWPLRIEFIHLPEMSTVLNTPLFPYLLSLAPQDPHAFPIEWQIVTMGPEKHTGYAIQWFAFALTLLILSVALNSYNAASEKKTRKHF